MLLLLLLFHQASPVTDHVSKKTSVRSEGSFGRHYHHYYNTTPTHHVDALLPTVYSLPLTPNFHHYTHTTLPLDSNLTTTYPSLPPRPQFIPPSLSSSSSSSASSYVAKAAVLAATPTYLHTGLERPVSREEEEEKKEKEEKEEEEKEKEEKEEKKGKRKGGRGKKRNKKRMRRRRRKIEKIKIYYWH